MLATGTASYKNVKLKQQFMGDWRDKLGKRLSKGVESLLRRIKAEEEAYKSAKEQKIAQIWVALADLNQRLSQVEKELEDVERRTPQEVEEKKIEDQVLRDSLESY